MQRPFASGSRQAPDPFDQFLEENGYYRKHTARDSSCLFRTISEQMFDTQMHHLSIRKSCVDFMRKNKTIFQYEIDKDYDEYLDDLSKPKTYGTALELRAMAYLYKRNVILFEAFNTGQWMVQDNEFVDVFRVFFTPEKHFDSVFTNEFIEKAAFCQSICYDILYKEVFKLPDVTYAVEYMLHANSFEDVKYETEYDGPYAKRLIVEDGRVFCFDRPSDTCCILDNYKLCHFHNRSFSEFIETLNQDMCETSQCDSHKIARTFEALLSEKYVSCVRQLLSEGITPFPYKVAKALDPDIYRNIEFDAWSEVRKENRFKNWYTGGSNFQVGVKCLVRLTNSQVDLYTCHIQEMPNDNGPCLVYVEELGEKHIVPYDYLKPLPSEQAKPWPLPFRYQKHIDKYPGKLPLSESKKNQRNSKNKALEFRYYSTVVKTETFEDDQKSIKDEVVVNNLKQYTTFQHFQPTPVEYLAMPLHVDRKGDPKSNQKSTDSSRSGQENSNENNEDEGESDYTQPQENYSFPGYGYLTESYYTFFDNNAGVHTGPPGITNGPPPPYYCMYNPGPVFSPNGSTMSHSVYVPPPVHCTQAHSGYYPSSYYQAGTQSSSSAVTSVTTSTSTSSRRNVSTFALSNRINYAAPKSEDEAGSDLPTDIPTLRYFYNMGVEYFKKKFGSNTNAAIDGQCIESTEKNDDVNKLQSDFLGLKFERGENSNNSQAKTDSNNNNVPNNNSNQAHSARRFHSRYFNNKKNNFSSGRTRYSSFDYNKKNNSNNGSNSSKYSKFAQSSASSTEQAIQTSPVSTMSTTDNANDATQSTPPANPPSTTTYPPYIPVYPAEGDQQPGVYVPQAVLPVPYSLYGPPPPHPPHGPTYPAYVSPAPPPHPIPVPAASYPPHTQTTYYPQSNESSSIVGAETPENGHYAFMSYSPVYYPANNGAVPPAAGPIQQGYWYTAPAGPVPGCPVSAGMTNQANLPNYNSANSSNPSVSQ